MHCISFLTNLRCVVLALAVLTTSFAHAASWVDITKSCVVNPNFDGSVDGWGRTINNSQASGYQGASYNNNGVYIAGFYESWRPTGWNNDGELNAGDMSQTIFLSEGKYRLSLDCIVCNQNTDREITTVHLFAQEEGQEAYTTDLSTRNGKPEHYSVEFTVVDGGSVDIGIRVDHGNHANWVAFDNVRVEFLSAIPVTGIQLSDFSLELQAGDTHQLGVLYTPEDASIKLCEWASDNTSVVTVDGSGNLYAKGIGKAVITATSAENPALKATCSVTVKAPEANPDGIIINEIQASNIDMFLDPSFNYGSWIEVYNPTDQSSPLGGLFISDDPNNLKKHQLPFDFGNVPVHGFCNIWFDHYGIWSNGELYQVNFKLNYDGGTIIISDGQTVIAQQVYPQAVARTSYARTTDGGDEWGVSATPTPEESNEGMTFAAEQIAAPVVNKDGQQFSTTLMVKVTVPAGATLRYTTDGTTPTLSNGSTSATGAFSVAKTAVYRFRAFKDGYLPSDVVTRSYIKERNDIDIISLVTDESMLYSSEYGIFAKGPNGRAGNGQDEKCNWNMDWDRPVNFEFITKDGEYALSQEVDIAACGGWSRAYTPHSFKLKAGKYYSGKNSMDYQFFEAKPYLKHKTLQMRNGGNNGLLKDAGLQEVMRRSGLDVETQAWRPVLVYVNGQYFGQLNMREPNNKHYASANYGIDTEEMDQFEMSPDSGYVQMVGTKDAFDRLVQLSANAANESTYAEICKLLDIDEYINYMAVELYLANWDWPQNNVKGFRDRNDGRFRFVVFDLDGSFNTNDPFYTFANKKNYEFDVLRGEDAIGHSLWGKREKEEIEFVTLFLNLCKNQKFARRFVDAFCVIGGSTFSYDYANSVIQEMAEQMNYYHGSDTANGLLNRQATLASSMKDKTAFNNFGLKGGKTMSVKLSSSVEGAQIHVNDYNVPMGKFSGLLYSPVTVKAVAPAGYDFKGWRILDGSTGGLNDVTVFDKGTTWTYDDSNTSLDDTDWKTKSLSKSGKAPLGYDTQGWKDITTKTKEYNQTYYFTKKINIKDPVRTSSIFTLDYTVDDGMIVYVNGEEAGRYNMPEGEVSFNTNGGWAQSNPDTGTMILPSGLFNIGENIIAIELHNYFNNGTSTDIYWDAKLTHSFDEDTSDDIKYVTTDTEYTIPAGSIASLQAVYEEMDMDDKMIAGPMPVKINEVSAGNDMYVNDMFKKDDWIELYNTTANDIDIAGMYISDKAGNPLKYQIPSDESLNTIIPAHGHLVLWASKRTGTGKQIHLPFKLENGDDECIVITEPDGLWSDTLRYSAHGSKETVGLYPDGGDLVYHMGVPTIGKSNIIDSKADYLYTYVYEGVRNPDDDPDGGGNPGDSPVSIASVNTAVAIEYYTLAGAYAGTSRTQLMPGIYVAKYHLEDGTVITKKLNIR